MIEKDHYRKECFDAWHQWGGGGVRVCVCGIGLLVAAVYWRMAVLMLKIAQ